MPQNHHRFRLAELKDFVREQGDLRHLALVHHASAGFDAFLAAQECLWKNEAKDASSREVADGLPNDFRRLVHQRIDWPVGGGKILERRVGEHDVRVADFMLQNIRIIHVLTSQTPTIGVRNIGQGERQPRDFLREWIYIHTGKPFPQVILPVRAILGGHRRGP